MTTVRLPIPSLLHDFFIGAQRSAEEAAAAALETAAFAQASEHEALATARADRKDAER